MRRPALLALLLVLAGCSGTAVLPPGVDAPERLAPGVTSEGVTDASALTSAHIDAIERDGFRSFSRVNYTGQQYGEGPFADNRTRFVAATSGLAVVRYRTRSRIQSDGEMRHSRYDDWRNESVSVSRQTCIDTENVVYERHTVNETDGISWTSTHDLPIAGFLRNADYEVTNVSQTENRTLVTLEADSLNRSAETLATEIDARVVVDDAGRIHELSVTRQWPIDSGDMAGTTAVHRVHYELREIGVEDIQRPAWFETGLTANESAAC